MNKIKIVFVVLLHFITFMIIEILTYQWAQNNNREFSVLFLTFTFYLFFSIPTYLILIVFYIFYKKINIVIRKIIWFILNSLLVLSIIISMIYVLYLLPFIPDDGDEGFAMVFASFFNCIFLVGMTSFIFLLSKKFFEDIFGKNFKIFRNNNH